MVNVRIWYDNAYNCYDQGSKVGEIFQKKFIKGFGSLSDQRKGHAALSLISGGRWTGLSEEQAVQKREWISSASWGIVECDTRFWIESTPHCASWHGEKCRSIVTRLVWHTSSHPFSSIPWLGFLSLCNLRFSFKRLVYSSSANIAEKHCEHKDLCKKKRVSSAD